MSSGDSTKNRVRVNVFWEGIQEKNIAKPLTKKAPEGESCGTCRSFVKTRCNLKNKRINHYNICGEWISK